MKRFLFILSVLLADIGAFAQGTVNFSNYALESGVNAPMTGETGNGLSLLGSAYLAQLYAGSTESSLYSVGTAVFFRNSITTGMGTGCFTGGEVYIASLQPQTGGYFQVRFWLASAGATYESALATGGLFGLSNVFHLAPLGDPNARPPGLPVDLVGLQPASIEWIPEPSTLALGLLGVAAFALRRHKSC
ncbi:MAG: PEP-CTERM sorting domain-containing protein [Verrucomicrobiota bacterium]|jgi:hypothetical protein